MATPYLQYADMINRGGDFSQGLSALGQTIDQERMMQRQAQQDAQTRRLSDLQIESAGLNFAQDKARSLADINQYGTQGEGDFTQQLAAAEVAKTKEMQMQKQREAKQKGMETYLNTISILDKMPNLDEATKTAIGKEFLKQNPEYAPIAEKLTFVSSKGVKAAREFGEGELKDPVTGKPLPAGYYETEGTWTGDAANPVKLTSYKLIEDKQPKHVPEGAAVPDGKGGWKIPAPKKEKPIIINTGGRGSGKPPVGYRFTADGNLEAIPGGPADQKVTAAGKAQEGGVAAIDTAINSINDLLTHPGRLSATGFSSLTNKIAIPGGAASTFLTKLDAFKSQMFVPMVQQLKGMGQLSDAEGKRLVAAVGALEPNMSEREFKSSLETILAELKSTRERVAKPLTRAEYTPAVPVTPQNRPKSKKADPLGIL